MAGPSQNGPRGVSGRHRTRQGPYWESVEEIPEPHGVEVTITIEDGGHAHAYETQFSEHDHGHGHAHMHEHELAPADDPLYAPLRGETAMLTRHSHLQRNGSGAPHGHWHDHLPATAHPIAAERMFKPPPLHEHGHKTSARTALILIRGSSPMVEGTPAFFAAGKYGLGLIVVMALAFAMSTIATYMLLCVYSMRDCSACGWARLSATVKSSAARSLRSSEWRSGSGQLRRSGRLALTRVRQEN